MEQNMQRDRKDQTPPSPREQAPQPAPGWKFSDWASV